MPFDYAAQISELSQSQRIEFYGLFAHNLTVGIRCICYDKALDDAKKVGQVR